MTVKEYLQRARDMDRRIHNNMLEACRLRSIAEKATSTITAMRVSGTPNRSKVEDATIRLMEMEDKILAEIEECVRTRNEIREVIKRVRDPAQRTVLHLRYLCDKSWEAIAVELHYTYRHITRLHGCALQACEHVLVCPKKRC